MSNMLASDLANPDFANPINPENSLGVKFYSKPLQDNFRTEQEGRPIYNDVDMVRITSPGDQLSVIDTIATDHYKKRFPRQWAFYQSKQEGDQLIIGRTPLSAWPKLTAAQVEELRHMKFHTVEDVANASDIALQNIGMIGGMGGSAFRDAAQLYLRVAKDASAVDQAQKETAALRAEMNAMREEMQKQMAGFAHLAAQTAAQASPVVEQAEEVKEQQDGPRRGRPPKE